MNMTHRQMSEMMSSGWGEWKIEPSETGVCYTHYFYHEDEAEEPVGSDIDGEILVRPWIGEAWIEPTEELYKQFYVIKHGPFKGVIGL